jgi:hypothetical protein
MRGKTPKNKKTNKKQTRKEKLSTESQVHNNFASLRTKKNKQKQTQITNSHQPPDKHSTHSPTTCSKTVMTEPGGSDTVTSLMLSISVGRYLGESTVSNDARHQLRDELSAHHGEANFTTFLLEDFAKKRRNFQSDGVTNNNQREPNRE